MNYSICHVTLFIQCLLSWIYYIYMCVYENKGYDYSSDNLTEGKTSLLCLLKS